MTLEDTLNAEQAAFRALSGDDRGAHTRRLEGQLDALLTEVQWGLVGECFAYGGANSECTGVSRASHPPPRRPHIIALLPCTLSDLPPPLT